MRRNFLKWKKIVYSQFLSDRSEIYIGDRYRPALQDGDEIFHRRPFFSDDYDVTSFGNFFFLSELFNWPSDFLAIWWVDRGHYYLHFARYRLKSYPLKKKL